MYPFDGTPAQDQKEDKMEEEETAPDQKGDMNDPDGFISRIKSQEKPGFRGCPPDNKGGQVPPEACVKKEVIHPIPFSGRPGSEEDCGSIGY